MAPVRYIKNEFICQLKSQKIFCDYQKFVAVLLKYGHLRISASYNNLQIRHKWSEFAQAQGNCKWNLTILFNDAYQGKVLQRFVELVKNYNFFI